MCSLPPLLFDGPSLRHVPAVKHGNEHENIAVKEYIAAMATCGNGIHGRQCGIALHTDYQFIGASPDGMVCDQSAKPRFGVLEVKCPFSAYAKCWSLKDAAEQDKGFCLQFQDGQLRLKKKHPYYWQVQGQMAITNTSWCDFVVWVSGDIHIERIPANTLLWDETILPALLEFYAYHALPYLVKLNRRNPTGTSPPLHHGNRDQRQTAHRGFTRYETLLAYDQCQSRIDGRNGSNACVAIGLSFIYDFLQLKTCSSSAYLCKLLRDGNAAYDSLNTTSPLSADTAPDVLGLGLEYSRDVFVRLQRIAYQSLLEDFSLICQASQSGLAGGIFICTPYSFAVCCSRDVFYVFDSHAHGNHGSLPAEVPIAEADVYLEHFFASHYGHLRFDSSAAANVFAQMTFVQLS